MTSCSSIEICRCRPLLGTFVEITVTGPDEATLNAIANTAFAAIERIQKLMSVHDAESELSLLNANAHLHPVPVSHELFQVLRRANRLAAESGGAFDCTVAPQLARWGLLPGRLKQTHGGTWRDVLLLHGRNVHFLRPLALDLSGIAKGFAVDTAIQVLRKSGATSGIVNAGGDLRTFGAQPAVVHLRHPARPQEPLMPVFLQDAALATSSPCFTEKNFAGLRVSHLVNSLTGTAISGAVSVSVRARECWLADALTKVVLNAPSCAQKLLAKYEAEAFVLNT